MSALRAPAQPEPEGQWSSLYIISGGCPAPILLDAWEERKRRATGLRSSPEPRLVGIMRSSWKRLGRKIAKAQAQWF